MNETFSCPSCGGTLEFAGKGRTVKCPYCGTVAEVPEALWRPADQAQQSQQWTKWIVIFLLVTVVLPTCIGILGAMLGVGGGVLAAVLPFLLDILGR